MDVNEERKLLWKCKKSGGGRLVDRRRLVGSKIGVRV